ncbi:MAG: DUF4357 domain-containing protein, partial [Selenomonadaceae bacterium]|nr:DUF4357 domain-containing protein [Selenomonadaceae bacterium]
DESNLSANMKKLRHSTKIVDGKLIEDVEFPSASTAALFVIGNNVNGLHDWKTRDGVPLKNFLR